MGKAIRAYFKGDCPTGVKFNGIPVQDVENPGNSYVTWDSGWEIPAGIFSRFTVLDIWPAENIRELGVYNHKSARAELDKSVNGGISCYTLALSGTELNDLLELDRMIRAGKIRPTESWEARQTPSETDELLAELEKIRAEFDEIARERVVLTAGLAKLRDENRALQAKAERVQYLCNLPWYKWLLHICEIYRVLHHRDASSTTMPPAAT